MTYTQDCKKINSLISLYLDNRLDNEKMLFVKNHLEVCPDCNEKYLKLKKLLTILKGSYERVADTTPKQFFNIREYEFFEDKLDEFVDNELDEIDSNIIQAYVNNTQIAQRKYNETQKLREVLSNQFEKIKQEMPMDFSKQIAYDLKNEMKIFALPVKFYKTVAVMLGFFFLFSAAYFPSFKKVKHPLRPAIKKKKVIYVKVPKKKPENIAGSFL